MRKKARLERLVNRLRVEGRKSPPFSSTTIDEIGLGLRLETLLKSILLYCVLSCLSLPFLMRSSTLLFSFASWDHVASGLDRGRVEAVWRGSGDGLAVSGGSVVYRVSILVLEDSENVSHPSLKGFGYHTTTWPLFRTVLGLWPTWPGTHSISGLVSILIALFDRLTLNYNQLTCLPDSLGSLTNLAECGDYFNIWFQFSSSLSDRLSLYWNQLTTVPDSIGLLTNLTEYGIEFEIFSPNFSSFSFDRLNLNENVLESLPHSMGNLKKLK